MKKLALACILAFVLSPAAMGSDIAFYVGTPNVDGWYDVPSMQGDVETIITESGSLFTDIQQFDDDQLDDLAAWVVANTDDGEVDVLWLPGTVPSTLYPVGNAQPDGSPIENFINGGNLVINVGDWFGYVTYEGGSRSSTANGSAGAANILNLAAGIISGGAQGTMTVTAAGQEYLPSLNGVAAERPVSIAAVVAPWEVAEIFGENSAGTYADPIVIHNTETDGYVAFINQATTWINERGMVCAEFINNWANEFIGLSDPEQAKDPSPDKGEIDVLRDVTLSWAPGLSATTHNVYFGTAFDDVNDATVANPMGVLLSQGQSGLTYDLSEPLDFGTTYYWRVDEVGAGVVKGTVWSFTTEQYAYAIQNVTATSNTTSQAGQGPDRIVDGSGLNENGEHSTNTAAMWGGVPNPDEPSYLLFEFDGVYKLHEMLIWNYNMEFEMFLGLGVQNATFEYSEDGENWTTLGDFDLAQATSKAGYTANTTIPFDGVAAKYVRMTINSNFSGSTSLYGLSEVRFMSIPVQPSQPQPAEGATDVDITTALSWRTGREAASHEVNLGTDPNALTLAGTAAQTSYTPAGLDLDTTYYWQVVEVNDAEAISAWAGDVWSFTTQPYLVVDDFDSYNDDIDAGTTIWQGWVDGIDDPTNGGAVVGNASSPFAEQTIVRSGQSMNFNYNNASASAISEADHTLSPAQDWTANGIKSLSLWFRGTAGNTGSLYIKINNTKVTYGGPAADIAVAGWHKWSIVLADTGASLSNVSSLSIGVDGTGSGTVYVDDIHLSPEVSTAPTSNIEIAISAQANWWSQPAADREMEKVVDNAQAPAVVFGAGDEAGLADWVAAHTGNGVANLLILCGKFPDSIYAGANAQPDGSPAELFLDDGNTIINTGDWIFYVGTVSNNNAAGLQNMMDIPAVTVAGGDNTAVTVTADGQTLTPSLQDFATDRPFHLDTLEGDWSTELVLAQTADGLLADPVVVRNSVTGGRIGVFYQSSGEDDLPRGEVISEWINNWYLDAAGN